MAKREGGGGVKDRLWVVGVLGGVAALVILAVAVFKFGIKDPSPPSMRDEPNGEIAGQIAYLSEGSGCVRVVAAGGGESREVSCALPQYGGQVTWLDEGHLAVAVYGPGGVDWRSIDIETGEEEGIGAGDPSKPEIYDTMVSPRGERLQIDYPSGDVYRMENGDRVRIFDYDGPDSWTPEYVTWSPDGEWVLLRYAKEEELWVVRRDGSFAGTLVGDAAYGRASWWMDGLGALPEVNLPE